MNLLLPPREFIAHSGVSREMKNHHKRLEVMGFTSRTQRGTSLASNGPQTLHLCRKKHSEAVNN